MARPRRDRRTDLGGAGYGAGVGVRIPPARRAGHALRRALRERRGRGATILISQRLHTIRGADQILVLDDGAVCGLGDHDTLYATCPAYREICQTQLETEEAGA